MYSRKIAPSKKQLNKWGNRGKPIEKNIGKFRPVEWSGKNWKYNFEESVLPTTL